MNQKKLDSPDSPNQRAESAEAPEPKPRPLPPVEHQFKPGNPGRPKGSRNKLGEAFIADLYSHWQKHGMDAIERVASKRPQDYLKVIASILPKDLHVRVGQYDELSDEQLVSRIRQLDARIRPFLELKATEPTDNGEQD
jgi:hypothetical protein